MKKKPSAVMQNKKLYNIIYKNYYVKPFEKDVT